MTSKPSPIVATRETPCQCGHVGFQHRIDFPEQARKECYVLDCGCTAFVPKDLPSETP